MVARSGTGAGRSWESTTAEAIGVRRPGGAGAPAAPPFRAVAGFRRLDALLSFIDDTENLRSYGKGSGQHYRPPRCRREGGGTIPLPRLPRRRDPDTIERTATKSNSPTDAADGRL